MEREIHTLVGFLQHCVRATNCFRAKHNGHPLRDGPQCIFAVRGVDSQALGLLRQISNPDGPLILLEKKNKDPQKEKKKKSINGNEEGREGGHALNNSQVPLEV